MQPAKLPDIVKQSESAISPGQSAGLHWAWLSVTVALGGLAWAGYQGYRDPRADLRHPAVIITAYTAFALWVGAVALMLQAAPGEWTRTAPRFRVTRITWLLAVLAYAVHVLVAFHFGHRWQHANAYEHVQASSGFGPGIFASYAFTVFWLADAFWFFVWPSAYLRRPAWAGWLVQGTVAFFAFNGTAVFGHGAMRGVSAIVFAVLAGYWLWNRVKWKVTP